MFQDPSVSENPRLIKCMFCKHACVCQSLNQLIETLTNSLLLGWSCVAKIYQRRDIADNVFSQCVLTYGESSCGIIKVGA